MVVDNVISAILEHGAVCDNEWRDANLFTRMVRLLEAGKGNYESEFDVFQLTTKRQNN